jgi:hypothetical protein
MNPETDIVESLLRRAGRRVEPPRDAYHHVLAVASDAFRRKAARQRQRRWLAVAAAASVVIAVAIAVQWPALSGRGELATIERIVGGVELGHGEEWERLDESRGAVRTGRRLRTRPDGRVALALAGGASLRLGGDTAVLRRGHHALAPPRRGEQQIEAEHDVDQGADDEQPLEAEQRHERQAREGRADDRAERVHRVHAADRVLPGAAHVEGPRDEGQRHARAEGRREHHGEAQQVAREREQPIPLGRGIERLEQRDHPPERRDVDRQRGDREAAHDPLHDAERADRVR